MNVEALRRPHSPRQLVQAVFFFGVSTIAVYLVGLTYPDPYTPLTFGALLSVGLLVGAVLTKVALSWSGTLALQLVKLLIVGVTLLFGKEVFATPGSARLLILTVAPYAAVLLGIIVSYEMIFVLLRWQDPDVPIFPLTDSQWYSWLRGIEVAAIVVGLAVIFYGRTFSAGDGPVSVPGGPLGVFINNSLAGLLVMAGSTIRALGELFHYTVRER